MADDFNAIKNTFILELPKITVPLPTQKDQNTTIYCGVEQW
jgi:hypothetical protein